jgi:Flp pilus assembly pilin Flp
MTKPIGFAKKLAVGEDAATVVEYGLLVALVALAVAAAAFVLGRGVDHIFRVAGNSV